MRGTNRDEDDFEAIVADESLDDWAKRSERNPFDVSQMGCALREAGLPQGDVAEYGDSVEAISRMPSITEQEGVAGWWGRDPDAYDDVIREEWQQRRHQAVSALRDLLGRKKFRVLERTTQNVDIPLFVLGSPPVPGSCVTYAEAKSAEAAVGWTVKVFGTGMGADATLRLESRGSFMSKEGMAKRVILPATIAVSRIGVYKGRTQIGEGARTEIESAHQDAVVELFKRKGRLAFEKDAKPLEYPLARDTSGDIATYERKGELIGTIDLELGLDAFNIATKVRASIQRKQTATLRFDLPAGIDYTFRYLRQPSGVWCVAPLARNRRGKAR